jgi:hypothetical protein
VKSIEIILLDKAVGTNEYTCEFSLGNFRDCNLGLCTTGHSSV